MLSSATNLYENLDCKLGARIPQIRSAYRRALAKVHPDHPTFLGVKLSKQEQAFLKRVRNCITKTYDILTDEHKRKAYNELYRRKALKPHGGIKTNFAAIERAIQLLLEKVAQKQSCF